MKYIEELSNMIKTEAIQETITYRASGVIRFGADWRRSEYSGAVRAEGNDKRISEQSEGKWRKKMWIIVDLDDQRE